MCRAAFLFDSVELYARGLHHVLENGGTPGDAHSIVQAMKDQSFNGVSGLVSLDDRGDRALDVEFLNVLDGDVWPVVAHYNMRNGNLSLVGNITWMGGSTTKVQASLVTCVPHLGCVSML